MKHHKKVPQARLSQGLQPQKPPPQKNAPLSAAVESDTVGYTTIEMEGGGWYIVGNPFEELPDMETGEKVSTFTLNERFTGFSSGDIIYLLSSDGTYLPRFWIETAEFKGWSKANVPLPNFLDNTEYPVETAVYIHKNTPGVITLSGRVSSRTLEFAQEKSFNRARIEDGRATEAPTWQLVCLPYPDKRTISDYTWTGCSKGDVLYYVSPDGTISQRFWNTNTNSWSVSSVMYIADTKQLEIGQGVFICKGSAGSGTVTAK